MIYLQRGKYVTYKKKKKTTRNFSYIKEKKKKQINNISFYNTVPNERTSVAFVSDRGGNILMLSNNIGHKSKKKLRQCCTILGCQLRQRNYLKINSNAYNHLTKCI